MGLADECVVVPIVEIFVCLVAHGAHVTLVIHRVAGTDELSYRSSGEVVADALGEPLLLVSVPECPVHVLDQLSHFFALAGAESFNSIKLEVL